MGTIASRKYPPRGHDTGQRAAKSISKRFSVAVALSASEPNAETPNYQRVQTLYISSLVKVFDVCCRAECRTCSAEEHASGHLLVLPRAGVCVQHRSRREEIIADPTRLLFFNRGEPCRFSHPVPGGDDCTAIAFEEKTLHEFLCANNPAGEGQPLGQPFSRSFATASPRTTLLLQRLRQHLFLGASANALVVEETVASLLACSLNAAAMGPVELPRRLDTLRAHRELAQRARLLLATKYRQKLALRSLAKDVHSSPFHLARVFRSETGQSIHGYVLRLRLQAALERVASDSRVDLTTLALELGFASHAHLSEAFRREFGVPPSSLRHRSSRRLLGDLSKRLAVDERMVSKPAA